MRNMRVLRRIGWRTAVFTIAGAFLAVTLAAVLVNLIRPGDGVDREVAQRLLESTSGSARALIGENTSGRVGSNIVELVPNNIVRAAADGQLIPVMLFALLFGVGLVLNSSSGTSTLRSTLEGVFNVSMTLIGLLIHVAPVAIACLVFDLAARFGWDLLARLGAYVGVVLLALLIQTAGVYALILRFVAGVSPAQFFRQSQDAILTGFSTASSNATLPTTLLVAEKKLLIPKFVARFVLTIGASTNHHGTAMFEVVAVLFLAQFFGISLSIAEQAAAMALCVLASMSTAAVPTGSLPVVAAMLGLFGIPAEGIGLILGVDRLLDMCRTAVNVTGGLTAAVVIARDEVPEPASPAT
jgi:Na+/H+-dicarboxylate symporter